MQGTQEPNTMYTKPASRIQRIFDALATFATVAGLLGIIQWIGG